MTYTLIPKNGNGCKWYMKADQLFKTRLVKVHSVDGFETIVDINFYNIVK